MSVNESAPSAVLKRVPKGTASAPVTYKNGHISLLTPVAKSYDQFFPREDVYEATLAYFGEIPELDLSTDVWINKYALKRPKGKHKNIFAELTPRDMHDRLATEIALQDVNFEFKSKHISLATLGAEELAFFEARWKEYFDAFDHFRYLVPQGSPMSGIGNPFVRVSISNCVVVESPGDDISSISDTGKDLMNLFKRRCGVGVDISTLRPELTVVSNSAGTTTGAWSFADYYSFCCRMIGQNGRRGALMITLDVRHPDVDKFVVMKRDLTKVTGANVSIRLTDDFMHAVKADEDWVCKWPVEDHQGLGLTECNVEELLAKGGEWQKVEVNVEQGIFIPFERWVSDDAEERRVIKKFRARQLWYLINESAQLCAEPGLLFWDNYINNLPAHCYPTFKTVCVNPCSEIGLSPYDSCRLLSLNLKSFVKNPYTKDASFDYELWKKMVRLGMRAMDAIVQIEINYLTNIIEAVDKDDEKVLWSKLRDAAVAGRRTGLGSHGLADALFGLGVKYDSDDALGIVDNIYATMRDNAYAESVQMAKERGAFPVFDWELEKDCAFIQRLPQWLQDEMAQHGRRNIALLTMAPTGSVAIVSQTSSGIEPVFSLFYMRRKKINSADEKSRVDFVDQSGDKWQEFMLFHHALQEYLKQERPDIWSEWENVTATKEKKDWYGALTQLLAGQLPEFFVTAPQIDASRRVEIQGTIQRYIDHGISSTLNLPMGTSVETVQEIYEKAHEHGLKGVTVYVDGSRTGVLVNMDTAKKGRVDEIVECHAPKRPKELPCEIHRATIEGQQWTILVGLLNGKPYEVFGGLSETVALPKRLTQGVIQKRKCEKENAKGRLSCYDLVIGEDEDDQLIVRDIATSFNDGNYAWGTRMLSQSLRHGIPIQFIVEQLRRDRLSGLTSFSKVMARVLAKYVVDEETGQPVDFCKTGNCE